jgi:hypothetical protein
MTRIEYSILNEVVKYHESVLKEVLKYHECGWSHVPSQGEACTSTTGFPTVRHGYF